MPIKVACSCKKKFNVPSKYAGKKVKCPECKATVQIPAAGGAKPAKSTSKSAGKALTAVCECGKKISAKPEWAGKRVKCPACSQPLTIPGPKPRPSRAAEPDDAMADMGDLLADVGLADHSGGGRKCPECKSPMTAEAILCIQCGYNENLGRKMETYRPVTEQDRARKAAGRDTPKDAKDDKAGKKRKKWFGII